MLAMDLRARAIYHQIHPVKLATDVLTSFVALILLWQRRLTPALVVMLAPPVIVSTALIARGRLDFLVRTRAGVRMVRMTNYAMALRLAGMLVMAIGGWRHDAALLVLGAALIAGVWLWVLR
jgi:hypothetical protein